MVETSPTGTPGFFECVGADPVDLSDVIELARRQDARIFELRAAVSHLELFAREVRVQTSRPSGHPCDIAAPSRSSAIWCVTKIYTLAFAKWVGLTPDGGHLTGGTAGPAGRLSVCRASVGSTPRSSGSRLPAW